MSDGPFDHIDSMDGGRVPLYLVRFDKSGKLRSPRAVAHLLTRAQQASDIFVFSHGWNNTFRVAHERYRHFAEGFIKMRTDMALPARPDYRPILIGIIWPSIKYIWPWQSGPEIAGTSDGAEMEQQFFDLIQAELEELGADADAFAEVLLGQDDLSQQAARKAAELLLPVATVGGGSGEGLQDPSTSGMDVADILEAWDLVGSGGEKTIRVSNDDFGSLDPTPIRGDTDPEIAGRVANAPADLLRMGTAWSMKARAGRVGATGAADLLNDLLDSSTARIHCAGHSYGCRLMMSAIAAKPLHRNVESLLLLQAAVNRWCFAGDVLGSGEPGGYRPVLDRVDRPILSTFSEQDHALRKMFHLTMRGKHVGEPTIASIGDTDRYGALGGYGPAGVDAVAKTMSIAPPGTEYNLAEPFEIVAVDGTGSITGHGDISNESTWWAMHNLIGIGG